MVYSHFDFQTLFKRLGMRIHLNDEVSVWYAGILRRLAVGPLWSCELKLREPVTRVNAIHGEGIADLLAINRKNCAAVNYRGVVMVRVQQFERLGELEFQPIMSNPRCSF